MDGLRLASLYSFMPHRLKFNNESDKIFYDYAQGKGSKEEVKKTLKNSSSFFLYLSLIAKQNKKNVFDKDVIEAYWIGNSLLDNINEKHIKDMIINEFTKIGLKRDIALNLAVNVPKKAVPHHSFHVIHARTLGKTIPSLKNIDNCRISWGKVEGIINNRLFVSYKPLVTKNKIYFGDIIKKEITYDPKILNPKKDDFVSFHWNFALQKLTQEQLNNLKKYTEINVRAMNRL